MEKLGDVLDAAEEFFLQGGHEFQGFIKGRKFHGLGNVDAMIAKVISTQ